MCGIAGFYLFDESKKENYFQNLEAATHTLGQRGPDAGGTFTQDTVGLGHRRLSILDISERGNQPMEDATGRYVITFNGEVFNFISIREKLIKKGYEFRTDTDTEVVINAYAAWGLEALLHFNGFFAFAIYDKKEKSLFLARDRFGIKPLVYALNDQRLIFSSELKALKEFEAFDELDKQALNLYFQLTYIPAPFTVFKNAKKLLPGHFMEIREGHASIKKYYQPPFRPETMIPDYEEAKNELRERLESAVKLRMISDVPLGTFLSGGIDSSIISALAHQHASELHTFSIGYRDHPFFDETAYAESVAKKLGTRHHVFSLSNQDLLDHVHSVVDYLDEPFADSSALPMYILSRETRKHVTVALSGDGADELFSGYNKHEAWDRSIRKNAVNSILKLAGGMLRFLPRSRQNTWTNFFRQVEKYRNILALPLKERYWHLAAFIPEPEVRKLILTDFYEGVENFKQELLQEIDHSDLNLVLELDVLLVLAGDMLRKVDAMSMANSLEVRVPFLDHRVVETAFRIPSNLKLNEKGRKYILKEAFKDELPEEVFRRGKHGFEVPLLDWFKNELREELDRSVFSESMIKDLGILNSDEIKVVKDQLYSNNPGDSHIKVWQMYVMNRVLG